jgi:hypothetical protein
LNLRRGQDGLVLVHGLVDGEGDVCGWLHVGLTGTRGGDVMKPFIDATENGLAARLMMDACAADELGMPSRCPLLQILTESARVRAG